MMFYGADSAFAFQYQLFARDRYRPDFEWLLAHTGLSIRPMIELATWIDHQVTMQINTLLAFADHTINAHAPEILTGAFVIGKDALTRLFRGKARHFLTLFSVPINKSNTAFRNPFSYNVVTSRPLIDLGEALYVSNRYKLFEAIYESPYYWMLQDAAYRDRASEHRGQFLENAIQRLLRHVFGSDNVFANVVVRSSKAQIAAEADVLVAYDEFVLVVQAKSKRMTVDARAGDDGTIKHDFQAAVQAAYDQAVKFIELMVDGVECDLGGGRSISFNWLSMSLRSAPVERPGLGRWWVGSPRRAR